MNNPPEWLPQALKYGEYKGNWYKFLADVYRIFERDFKQSRPNFEGYPVTHDSKIENGKEATFWHIVERTDPIAKERVPDIRRCERIPWPRPIIEHSTDIALSVWRNKRKREIRVLIWMENLDYIVILAEKPQERVLITAFCTDIKSQCHKLRKERDKYIQMQKPPLRAA